MPNSTISQIKLPSGTTYDIKDTTARNAIAALTGGDAVTFGGVSTTALTDGGTEKPTVGGSQVNPTKGQLYFVDTQEFLWDGSKWIQLGDLTGTGALALKNKVKYDKATSASSSQPSWTGTGVRLVTGNIAVPATYTSTFTGAAMTSTGSFTPEGGVTLSNSNVTATVSAAPSGTTTYTPGGTVGTPTISVKTAGSTTTIKNPTSKTVVTGLATAAPGATAPSNAVTYYDVTDEVLSLYQLGATTGDSITTSNVTVKDGDAAYEASQPSWTGTAVRLVTGNISVPSSATFSGTAGDVSVSGTTTGSVATTTATTENKTTTVSAAASGTATYTPGGTVGTPTITLTHTTTEATYE